MKEQKEIQKDFIKERIINKHAESNNSRRIFSLSLINFDRINKNMDKINQERRNDEDIKQLNNNQIIFSLKYKMRKELYQLIDGSDNKNVENSTSSLNNVNVLGKKRNFGIPIIDLSHISIKEE